MLTGRGQGVGGDDAHVHHQPSVTATITRDPPGRPAVDVVVPVHNEERDLEACVHRLHAYLSGSFPFSFRITVADNASTDGTWPIAERLAGALPHVRAIRLPGKGRGWALREVWYASDASVLAYMDVDLSTDLNALLPLVAPLLSGHSDLAIGTRLRRGAQVVRGPKRELISRGYNLLLRAALGVRFSDAQCGFKAITAESAAALLPLVADHEWFFGTELLVLAERSGLRIHEVPVDWVDDPDSRVDIVPTAWADLRGVARLTRNLAAGRIPLPAPRALPADGRAPAGGRAGLPWQLLRFGLIGMASTLAYLVLFIALRSFWTAQAASATALLVTAVANTAANRAWTFSVRGRAGVLRHHFQGLGVFALALGLTAGALAGLHALAPDPHRLLEVTVVTVANLAATAVRFALLRGWVFRPRADRRPREPGGAVLRDAAPPGAFDLEHPATDAAASSRNQ